MNVRIISQGNPQTAPPRFDRKFIEDHQLVERYLDNKLPFKGARDLENWCRAHPDYLNELKLSERPPRPNAAEKRGSAAGLGRAASALVENHLCTHRPRRNRFHQPGGVLGHDW